MMPYQPRLPAALRCATLAVSEFPALRLRRRHPRLRHQIRGSHHSAGRGAENAFDSTDAAENALRAGDCHGAAENYLAAAQASSDPAVAARAAQLAVGCDQLPIAQTAATRWLALEPFSGDAALTPALVALKRYDLPDARKALTAWRDSGSAGSQDPLRFAELLQQETEATAVYRVFREVLVGEDPTAEVLLAEAPPGTGRAEHARGEPGRAARAGCGGSSLLDARVIVLRAQSVAGQHERPSPVRGSPRGAARRDVSLLADLLIAADRYERRARN